MRHRIRPLRRPARPSFTLVELLVVVAIIAVLLSLGTAAVMKVREVQQRHNTQDTITKLDQALQKQYHAVLDNAKSESPNFIAQNLSGGDPNRARVIHVLMCLKREFPTSFAEARNPIAGFPPNPAYVRALQNVPGRSPDDEASACLYLALTQVRRGTDASLETALSSQEAYDPTGGNVREVFDGWKQPLTFARWPYNLAALNPSGPAPFNPANPSDREDPEGLLTNAAWLQVNATNFSQTFGAPPSGYPINPQQPGTQYVLKPVIMSKGPNGKPFDADDLYNFQITAQGESQK
jgi:prepilin-type N-terminal cleavage/methylation domain-containing protein